MTELKELNWDKYKWNSKDNNMKPILKAQYEERKGYQILAPLEDMMLNDGYLIKDPDGELWHILQAPLKWENGISTEKETSNLRQFASPFETFHNHISGMAIDGTTLDVITSKAKNGFTLNQCIIFGSINKANISRISNSTIENIILFKANFEENISFINCNFIGEANIHECNFRSLVFSSCNFDSLTISNSEINGNFSLISISNHSNTLCKLNIVKAKFIKDVLIRNSECKDTIINIIESKFRENVDFKLDKISPENLFAWNISRSEFSSGLSILTDKVFPPHIIFNCTISKKLFVTKTKLGNHRNFILPNKILDNHSEDINNKYITNYEFWSRVISGTQELNKQMNLVNDKQAEWVYYDIEHYARLQINKINSRKSIIKRFLSSFSLEQLYDTFSGNGLSLTKPLIWLFLLWLVPSLIYLTTQAFTLIHQGDVVFSWNALVDGFVISASQMVLGSFKGDTKWLDFIGFMENNNLFLSVIDRIVAFLQNLFSIILVFLFGLAIRRRYQV
ncbi:pentapeptide repeat-containing protein [Pseudaquidulcibacter saccharophilus]|uniref:pentapeptide repeat-containing protein n=1 Tax=Pseudaquidulcibacter saccharophilus TaxID=2831900 RepID=UPI001EFF1929|nr:pentapeptide repeat-containing protein [Pseudaquidulcibacter saccharophilus]